MTLRTHLEEWDYSLTAKENYEIYVSLATESDECYLDYDAWLEQ